jgi:hypothetical protein
MVHTEHAQLTNSKVKLKHKHFFITGCSNSKLSTITDHEKSKGHWVWLWVWTKSQFYNCYQDNSPGCVTNLLNSLQWESLLQRRWKQTLVMCYKIHHQLIAIEPANYYTAGDSRSRGNHRLGQIRAKKDTYQHSFFPRSIREWYRVPSSVVDAGSLEDFKVRLNSIPCQAFITTQINDRAAVRCIYCTWFLFCIYHPSLWTFTCFGGAPCLIVYAPESHTLSNYRVRLVSGKKKKMNKQRTTWYQNTH